MFVLNVGFVLAFASAAVYHTRIHELGRTLTCNGIYGTVLDEMERVQSGMMCAMACINHLRCASSLYNTVTKHCTLNNETWPNPTTSGCTTDTIYFIDQCFGKSVRYSDNSCTNPLNNLRLCDGGGSGTFNPKRGRLEACYRGFWGTVCDDNWIALQYGKQNVDVACRMLGYTNGTVYVGALFGVGTGRYWGDILHCNGNETSLYLCPDVVGNNHACRHNWNVGVSCD